MKKKKAHFNIVNKVSQVLAVWFFKIYCAIKFDVIVEGRENLPDKDENYLIISNHLAFSDIPLLATIFKNKLAFIAKQELFKVPFLGFGLWITKTISVNREKLEKSTIKNAKAVLEEAAYKVAIFIEGTRSKIEGRLGKPNNGAIYIAKLCKVPVVPVGLQYQGSKVRIKIGKPYKIDPDKDLEEEAWSCLTKISKLSGASVPDRE